MAKKGNKKKVFKKLITSLLVIAITIGGFGGYMYYNNFKKSNIHFEGEAYLFIPKGANQDTVMNRLEKMNVVDDIKSLKWTATIKNYKNSLIVPGKYKLQNNWSNNQLINHLRAGNGRIDAVVSFNNVRTLKELSEAMTKEIELEPQEVYEWLTNPDSIQAFGFNQNTIISMFIPNTYYVDFDITTPELMRRMAKEYKLFWNDSRKQKLAAIGLSQSEATTLASIVFSETNSDKDMPTIAGVYMNRIKAGWPLQADPTLIFALNDYSIRRVLDKHKEVDSPYNTYKYAGLPPGPINIPPIKYIDAVLNYEKHDYYFFVAKEDFSGDSYFAKTYAQHLIYARRYQNALNKQNVFQ